MQFLIDALAALRYPKSLINQRLLPRFHPMDVPETQTVVKADDVPDKLFLLCEGMGRVYYKKKVKLDNGWRMVEVSRMAVGRGEWFTVPDAFVDQVPSSDQVEIIGPSKLFYICYEDYMRLCREDWEFALLVQRLWSRWIRTGFQREDRLKITNPLDERIDQLLAAHQQLEKYLPSRSILASLAGVSDSTMKRYFSKGQS